MDNRQLVAAVRQHAEANYTRGWDTIVECWDDSDILRVCEGISTAAGAISVLEDVVSLYKQKEDDVMCQSGEHIKCPVCKSWYHMDRPCGCKVVN